MLRGILLTLCLTTAAEAVVIDRVAIVIDHKPILASEIVREIRVTAFLNEARPDLSPASRKAAASRLIDQALIREQIRSGNYPVASQEEVEELFDQLKTSRSAKGAQLSSALRQYGINEAELRDRLSWQLTVLHFIDTRFRPEAVVSDEDVQHYYDSHRARFGSRPLAEVRSEIVEAVTGENINTLLDDWLAEARKSAHITYLEKSLA